MGGKGADANIPVGHGAPIPPSRAGFPGRVGGAGVRADGGTAVRGGG